MRAIVKKFIKIQKLASTSDQLTKKSVNEENIEFNAFFILEEKNVFK